MATEKTSPQFDKHFAFLDRFIQELVEEFQAGHLSSWDELEMRCDLFYTPAVMDAIEGKAPGWKMMSSYTGGITRTHVTCVFLGMYMLKQFQSLSFEEKQIVKWIVLFHDIGKFHIQGKKDTLHAIKSAVIAAKSLPGLGFPITDRYQTLIEDWSASSLAAYIPEEHFLKPDNQKLPGILAGIDELFGEHSPASVIVKVILLHISLAVDKNYPTPSPLTDHEIKQMIDAQWLPLLIVMYLADNDGWSLFHPDFRNQQQRDTLEAFKTIQNLVGPA